MLCSDLELKRDRTGDEKMKIAELFDELKSIAPCFSPDETCDTYKSGNSENEISKVALSMFATPEIIRKCRDNGVNFLIVHEPTFYNHFDKEIANQIGYEKKKLIDDVGLTIVRFHDYAHNADPDLISQGMLKYMKLPGRVNLDKKITGTDEVILDTPMTSVELAKTIEDNLNIKHIKIAGNTDKKGTRIACCFGTPGGVADKLNSYDFVLAGEICEWCAGEIVRDYSQLGYTKAILVMGHIGSERAGMMYIADILKEKHPEINIEYYECGELYSYTD